MPERWSGLIATDSQSLIDTLTGNALNLERRQTEPIDLDFNRVVLDVMIPEWDILIETQRSFAKLPGLQRKHIEGHQDDNLSYSRLLLLAQLNVDADRLARE